MNARFANAGNARLWNSIAGLFFLAGCLGLTERIWMLSADVYAGKTWPSAKGEILSVSRQDDRDFFRRARSISGRTRYWIEYQVAFSVPAEQCRSGIVYEGPAENMPCHGVVNTVARNRLAGSLIGSCMGIMRTNRLPAAFAIDSSIPTLRLN